ncbi:MAG: 7-carboxy-7-deazaguanine synthase QueE [Rikenellaceae bacterium]
MQSKKYPLVEEFYSIQGEGYHSGKAAYFIRLAGCDVACSWCDAKESWSVKKHPLVDVAQLVENVVTSGARYVVVTGGEPLLHDLAPLCSALHSMGVEIFLETSGTQPLSGSFDWICLSPKRNKKPLAELLLAASELKVVVEDDDSFSWALECADKVAPECLLYLQVEWSRSSELMPKIVDYAKRDPRWIISIQTHKYMMIP